VQCYGPSQPRTGRWTDEETHFRDALISHFLGGGIEEEQFPALFLLQHLHPTVDMHQTAFLFLLNFSIYRNARARHGIPENKIPLA
jgi:hypothetical protein